MQENKSTNDFPKHGLGLQKRKTEKVKRKTIIIIKTIETLNVQNKKKKIQFMHLNSFNPNIHPSIHPFIHHFKYKFTTFSIFPHVFGSIFLLHSVLIIMAAEKKIQKQHQQQKIRFKQKQINTQSSQKYRQTDL